MRIAATVVPAIFLRNLRMIAYVRDRINRSRDFLFDHLTLSQDMNFTLQTDLGDIDLLGDLSGLGQFPEVLMMLS
jgi:hypothetical protein